jgi:hypothetical protein
MPPLKFICPVTGNAVDTDIDEESFAALNDDTELSCPYCPQPHRINEVQGWFRDIKSELD